MSCEKTAMKKNLTDGMLHEIVLTEACLMLCVIL